MDLSRQNKLPGALSLSVSLEASLLEQQRVSCLTVGLCFARHVRARLEQSNHANVSVPPIFKRELCQLWPVCDCVHTCTAHIEMHDLAFVVPPDGHVALCHHDLPWRKHFRFVVTPQLHRHQSAPDLRSSLLFSWTSTYRILIGFLWSFLIAF